MSAVVWVLIGLVVAVLLLALYDVFHPRHALLRAYPLLGRARFALEKIGPELRQYWFLQDKSERPFDRTQRNWVYESAKGQPNTFGFGTEAELEESPNFLVIRHAPFPHRAPERGRPCAPPNFTLPCVKVIGEHRGRRGSFRPQSAVNVSAMSFGSLSGPAVQALNRGAAKAGCLHNTGEGGLSRHHQYGGELIFQIGTAYFSCRDKQGDFSLDELKRTLDGAPVRAIEIKLSQGAKPGLGGLLPAAKVTKEIAEVRGISANEDCVSPPGHSAFSNVDEMLDFVEMLADETGLPVGIKSAVGEGEFWEDLARRMAGEERGVDFITIDGGEGGTGAAPLVFTDHVSLPFKIGFTRAYKAFAREGITDQVVFIGSGRLGMPEAALFAFSLGADMVNVGREAMLAIGCIQAQICHTGKCPVGITTQSRWLQRAVKPGDKAERLASYVIALRGEMCSLARACGVAHPSLVGSDHLELLDEQFSGTSVRELFGYEKDWAMADGAEVAALLEELGEDVAEEELEEAAAHGVTPFPEAG
ncbi:MAG TPA: FMN-binding glutamate synthase family protein [Thermoleophilaceae bacterium]|nr:FMN-binding glutamate synthase family protein [Thermoleophilaceae bacterium]